MACEPLTLTILAPDAGAHVSAGSMLTLRVAVTNWDGGEWIGSGVPVAATGGVSGPTVLTVTSGTDFTGSFTMPNDAGSSTFTAGWPGVQKSVTVVTDVCTPGCEAWQECVVDGSGARCVDLGLMLTWVAPTEGQAMGPATASALALSLTVTRADGGSFSGTVPFALDGGASGVLTKSGPAWSATVDAGVFDGPRQVSAGWAGGPGAVRNFTVVATAPTVTLYPQDGVDAVDHDGRLRWKKSDVAKVQVESNRPLASLAATEFVNSGVTAATGCTRSCAAGATCACFDVDLSVQPYVQTAGEVFGTVDVKLNTLTDTYGNTTNGIATKQFQVTRLKWVKQIAAAATAAPALAITDGGLVIASVGNGLVALQPDGGTAWTVPGLNLTSAPMVGTVGIYVATTTTAPTAGILVYDFAGQSRPSSPICGVLSATTYSGDLALAQPGASEVPVAVRSDRRIAIGTPGCDSPSSTMSGLAGTKTAIVSGTDAFVAGNASTQIWRYSTITSGASQSGSASASGVVPSNLFDFGSGVLGGGAFTGGAFVFANGATTTVTTNPGATTSGAAVVGVGGVVEYGDTASRLWRASVVAGPGFASLSPPSVLFSPSASFAAAAPLLGDANIAYTMGDDGILHVVVDGSTFTEKWSWANGGIPTTGLSQLNIDINRDVADPCKAGEPGVLYFAASSASSTKVYALLVDSQGLPRTAPWPRYQHDPGNTGNAATDLTPWSCR